MEVPFYDICCTDAADNFWPVRFNSTSGGFERFNGTAWVAADDSIETIATDITAHSGGGQGSATALTAPFNNVTVAAAPGDSVKLMVASAGAHQTVANNGLSPIDVFPVSGSSIDGATDTAIRVLPGSQVTLTAINATSWYSDRNYIGIKGGTVTVPSVAFDSDPNTGIFSPAADHFAITAGGTKVVDASLAFGLSVVGPVSMTGVDVMVPAAVARNSSITLTAADMLSGYITSTSGAATSLTTPTATALATGLLAATGVTAAKGVAFEFSIDNVAGANTVTLVLDASIAVTTPVITGTNTLTVLVANGIARFRVVFTSGTTAKIFRLF